MAGPRYDIELETSGDRGRYVIRLDTDEDAEMTFRRTGTGTIAIDHTYVPPAYRGHDLALRLVERGIADARRDGLKIAPLCSYVAVQFRRHPDWTDLLAN